MSTNRHRSASSPEEDPQPFQEREADPTFPSHALDAPQFLAHLLHLQQVLAWQSQEVLETFCQEVALASHGQAQLSLLSKQRRRVRVPPSWQSFPVETNGRAYGQLSFAHDPKEPARLVVPFPVAQASAAICALILYSVELATLSSGRSPCAIAVPPPTFTPREKDVLELLCRGYEPPAIADMLHITTTTVNQYRRQICAKLGVQHAREAIFAAFSTGLFFPREDLAPDVMHACS